MVQSPDIRGQLGEERGIHRDDDRDRREQDNNRTPVRLTSDWTFRPATWLRRRGTVANRMPKARLNLRLTEPSRHPRRRRIPRKGRRVQGREAIACDAEGALDAATVTGTLTSEEDGRLLHRTTVECAMCRSPALPGWGRHGRAGRGLPRPEPGAGSAGRGAAGAALTP